MFPEIPITFSEYNYVSNMTMGIIVQSRLLTIKINPLAFNKLRFFSINKGL